MIPRRSILVRWQANQKITPKNVDKTSEKYQMMARLGYLQNKQKQIKGDFAKATKRLWNSCKVFPIFVSTKMEYVIVNFSRRLNHGSTTSSFWVCSKKLFLGFSRPQNPFFGIAVLWEPQKLKKRLVFGRDSTRSLLSSKSIPPSWQIEWISLHCSGSWNPQPSGEWQKSSKENKNTWAPKGVANTSTNVHTLSELGKQAHGCQISFLYVLNMFFPQIFIGFCWSYKKYI